MAQRLRALFLEGDPGSVLNMSIACVFRDGEMDSVRSLWGCAFEGDYGKLVSNVSLVFLTDTR